MMRNVLVIGAVALVCICGPMADAEQGKPEVDAAALELRATTAVNNKQWATALPLLKKVAEKLKDQPERLGQIEEQIRVCEKNLAKQGKTAANVTPQVTTSTTVTAVPVDPTANGGAIPTAAEQRKHHPAPKDGAMLEISIKELGNFDYDQEKGGNIPDDVKRLGGHPVRLRGFMIPMDQADNITKFALVPDLFSCCFGQPPQIQHMVVANCPQGKAVSYSPDEIVVEGKLNVEEKKDDGYIISIFEVGVTSVKPAPR